MDVFARWFASRAGVLQTTATCVVLVVLEYVFPSVDPHGFWLLFYLTVYSAVTQPVLAYVARKDGAENKIILERLAGIEREVKATEDRPSHWSQHAVDELKAEVRRLRRVVNALPDPDRRKPSAETEGK